MLAFVCFGRYKKYVFLDPLAGAVTKTHTTLETEKEEKPFDAPLSITKREQLERQVRPILPSMPLLELSDVLIMSSFVDIFSPTDSGVVFLCARPGSGT